MSTLRFMQFLLLALVMLWSGCTRDTDARREVQDVAPDAPRSVISADGVELTVAMSAREFDVGEPVSLDITVRADAGIDVEMPAWEESFGSFEIRAVERVPPIPVDGRRRWQSRLTLMTFEPGEVELPVVEVTYRRARQSETGEAALAESTLTSEPLTLVAHSVVGEAAKPTEYRDIKGLAEMPAEPAWKWWAIAGAAAVLLTLLSLAGVLLMRMRREPAVERVLAPHEWALRELDALERERLIEQRAFGPFYVRLSDIVRVYLERRFGLMAPERTTEEFLRDARRNRQLTDEHRTLLGEFLRAADMVKFARHEPMESDCRLALESARSFVEQTKPAAQAQQQLVEAAS